MLTRNVSENINSLLNDVCDLFIIFMIEMMSKKVTEWFYIHRKITNNLKSTLTSIIKNQLAKTKDNIDTMVSFLVLILNYKYKYPLR